VVCFVAFLQSGIGWEESYCKNIVNAKATFVGEMEKGRQLFWVEVFEFFYKSFQKKMVLGLIVLDVTVLD
jgi:hypothetical protein